jgi:hypothetical protein
MSLILGAGGAVLGFLPFVFSPTRTFARGGMWRFAGAALIVVSAMMLFWSVRDLTGDDAASGGTAADMSALGLSDADLKALEKIF